MTVRPFLARDDDPPPGWWGDDDEGEALEPCEHADGWVHPLDIDPDWEPQETPDVA